MTFLETLASCQESRARCGKQLITSSGVGQRFQMGPWRLQEDRNHPGNRPDPDDPRVAHHLGMMCGMRPGGGNGGLERGGCASGNRPALSLRPNTAFRPCDRNSSLESASHNVVNTLQLRGQEKISCSIFTRPLGAVAVSDQGELRQLSGNIRMVSREKPARILPNSANSDSESDLPFHDDGPFFRAEIVTRNQFTSRETKFFV
jgi:hypothetical protein